MRLGIVAAMVREARILSGGFACIQETFLLNNSVLLRTSGQGADRARIAARLLISQGADALISWGVAAGLSPALVSGDMVIPGKVIDSHGNTYLVDNSLRKRIIEKLAFKTRVHDGILAQCDSVVSRKPEKLSLSIRTGATIIDMESSAVASEAENANIPFVTVKAVADTLETDIPKSALDSIDEFGRVFAFRLMLGLVRRPQEIPGLIGLGIKYRAACSALRIAARETSLFRLEQGSDTFNSR